MGDHQHSAFQPISLPRSYFKDRQFAEQIEIDVERTQQGEPFFGGDDADAEAHRMVR